MSDVPLVAFNRFSNAHKLPEFQEQPDNIGIMSTMDTVVRFLQQLRTGQGVSERAAQILFTFKRDLQKEQDLKKEKGNKISSETKRAVEVPAAS